MENRVLTNRSNEAYLFCRDAMVTSVINCATSFLAGFVVFSVLGYMAYLQKTTDIEKVIVPGNFS